MEKKETIKQFNERKEREVAYTSKWQAIIDDLARTPGVEKLVAENVGPSTASRLRKLGATVRTVSVQPRGNGTYGRYDVFAMVTDDAISPEAPSRDEERLNRMLAAYERELRELDVKLHANTTARNKLLTKRRSAAYMKTQLLTQQDALRLRRNRLNKGDTDNG